MKLRNQINTIYGHIQTKAIVKRVFCQSGKFETSLFDDIKESFLSFRSNDGAIIIFF